MLCKFTRLDVVLLLHFHASGNSRLYPARPLFVEREAASGLGKGGVGHASLSIRKGRYSHAITKKSKGESKEIKQILWVSSRRTKGTGDKYTA